MPSPALTPPLEKGDHVLGSAGAPLELVMFGDFQCPYCLAAQGVVRRVRERLGERLLFGFRHLPIPSRHPVAEAAAEASESAAAQDRFWDYHDALYAAQPRLSEAELLAVADSVGLDAGRVESDLRDGTWRSLVERDVRSAEASGARGTPAFYVNGHLHTDVYDAGSLVAALQATP